MIKMKKRKKFNDIDWEKYKKSTKSCSEICKEVGCHHSTARRFLFKVGWKYKHDIVCDEKSKQLKDFWGKARKTTSLKYLNEPIKVFIDRDLPYPRLFKIKINEVK
jgi:hypothetical protein